jgi:hypothetical protein
MTRSSKWLFLVLMFVVPLQGYGQNSQPEETHAEKQARLDKQYHDKQAAKLKVLQQDESQGPLTDYDVAVGGTKRDHKPETEGGWGRVIAEDNLLLESAPNFHYSEQPIPLALSDTVAIGTVKSGMAHLSASKTNIYSDFQFRIDRVVEGHVASGETIDVVRDGGRIRFPSGKILVQTRMNQTLPLVGKQYLLFLQESELEVNPRNGHTTNHLTGVKRPTQDFEIVDGYDLSEGKVVSRLDSWSELCFNADPVTVPGQLPPCHPPLQAPVGIGIDESILVNRIVADMSKGGR